MNGNGTAYPGLADTVAGFIEENTVEDSGQAKCHALTNKITAYLDTIIYYGLHLVAVFLPIFISWWTDEQFELPKVTALWVLSTVLLCCWLVKTLLSPKAQIRQTSLDQFVLIFLVLAGISTLLSVDISTSMFGKDGRYEGFLTFLSFAALFFLTVQTFSDLDRLYSLAETMVVTAALISIYGLLQYLGFDFYQWVLYGDSIVANQTLSTFGNRSFLAGFLVMVLPIAFTLFLSQQSRLRFLVYGLFVFLIYACLIAASTRGAWLGGLFAFSLLVFLAGKEILRKKRHLLFIIASLSLLIVLAANFWPQAGGRVGELISRVGSIVDVSQSSAAARIEMWKSAIRIIASRPLLGYGPDSFELAFSKFQTIEFLRIAGRLYIADNAHNYTLQLASTLGVLAALVFLAIIVMFLYKSLLMVIKTTDYHKRLLYSGLLAGAVGYLIHLQFTVSVVESTSLMWIIFGLILAQAESQRLILISWKPSSFWIRAFLAASVILAAWGSFNFLARPYLADAHLLRASRFASDKHWGQAEGHYRAAVLLSPYSDKYRASLGNFYLSRSRETGERLLLEKAIASLRSAKKASSLKADNYIFVADAYWYKAQKFDPSYYTKAVTELKKAMKLRPNSSILHYQLASLYLEKEDKKALSELKRAIKIEPAYSEAYLELGKFYERLHHPSEALKAYKKALRLNADLKEAKEATGRLEQK